MVDPIPQQRSPLSPLLVRDTEEQRKAAMALQDFLPTSIPDPFYENFKDYLHQNKNRELLRIQNEASIRINREIKALKKKKERTPGRSDYEPTREELYDIEKSTLYEHFRQGFLRQLVNDDVEKLKKAINEAEKLATDNPPLLAKANPYFAEAGRMFAEWIDTANFVPRTQTAIRSYFALLRRDIPAADRPTDAHYAEFFADKLAKVSRNIGPENVSSMAIFCAEFIRLSCDNYGDWPFFKLITDNGERAALASIFGIKEADLNAGNLLNYLVAARGNPTQRTKLDKYVDELGTGTSARITALKTLFATQDINAVKTDALAALNVINNSRGLSRFALLGYKFPQFSVDALVDTTGILQTVAANPDLARYDNAIRDTIAAVTANPIYDFPDGTTGTPADPLLSQLGKELHARSEVLGITATVRDNVIGNTPTEQAHYAKQLISQLPTAAFQDDQSFFDAILSSSLSSEFNEWMDVLYSSTRSPSFLKILNDNRATTGLPPLTADDIKGREKLFYHLRDNALALPLQNFFNLLSLTTASTYAAQAALVAQGFQQIKAAVTHNATTPADINALRAPLKLGYDLLNPNSYAALKRATFTANPGDYETATAELERLIRAKDNNGIPAEKNPFYIALGKKLQAAHFTRQPLRTDAQLGTYVDTLLKHSAFKGGPDAPRSFALQLLSATYGTWADGLFNTQKKRDALLEAVNKVRARTRDPAKTTGNLTPLTEFGNSTALFYNLGRFRDAEVQAVFARNDLELTPEEKARYDQFTEINADDFKTLEPAIKQAQYYHTQHDRTTFNKEDEDYKKIKTGVEGYLTATQKLNKKAELLALNLVLIADCVKRKLGPQPGETSAQRKQREEHNANMNAKIAQLTRRNARLEAAIANAARDQNAGELDFSPLLNMFAPRSHLPLRKDENGDVIGRVVYRAKRGFICLYEITPKGLQLVDAFNPSFSGIHLSTSLFGGRIDEEAVRDEEFARQAFLKQEGGYIVDPNDPEGHFMSVRPAFYRTAEEYQERLSKPNTGEPLIADIFFGTLLGGMIVLPASVLFFAFAIWPALMNADLPGSSNIWAHNPLAFFIRLFWGTSHQETQVNLQRQIVAYHVEKLCAQHFPGSYVMAPWAKEFDKALLAEDPTQPNKNALVKQAYKEYIDVHNANMDKQARIAHQNDYAADPAKPTEGDHIMQAERAYTLRKLRQTEDTIDHTNKQVINNAAAKAAAAAAAGSTPSTTTTTPVHHVMPSAT